MIKINWLKPLWFFVFLGFSLGLPSTSYADYNVGYRSLSYWDSFENIRLDISLWYPTERRERVLKYGEWEFLGAKNAPFIKEDIIKEITEKPESTSQLKYKRFPLILFSHDVMATRYSYSSIARKLVQAGFIVAAPVHVGYNSLDMSRLKSDDILRVKSLEIIKTLSILRENRTISSVISEDISFVGVGSTSMIGLLLAGSRIDYDAVGNFKKQSCLSVEDKEASEKEKTKYFLKERHMSEVVTQIARESEKARQLSLYYETALEKRKEIQRETEKKIENIVKNQKRRNYSTRNSIITPPILQAYFPPIPSEQALYDKRFRNIVLISPQYISLFEKESIQRLNVHVTLIDLEKEICRHSQGQGDMFKTSMRENLFRYSLIENADIASLTDHCISDLPIDEICYAVDVSERSQIHTDIAEEILKALQP